MKKILGVSGSPIKNSNTDRALAAALAATGLETEFIKLSRYKMEPCRACLGCVNTNECVIGDDGNILTQKAREADGLIIAGYTPYSSLDARSKTFMERLYPLRHQHGLMQGKPGAAIVTCAVPRDSQHMPPACQNGVDSISYYMMEEGMNFLGGMTIQGNVPCIRCGHGDQCDMSGLKMIHGLEATVKSVGVNRVEDQKEAMKAARDLGKKIAGVLG
ncbi:MAG: flavodoxin family protein [Desulfurivibrionaceae bacterium]